jgi:Ca-activated chloride channel family protein
VCLSSVAITCGPKPPVPLPDPKPIETPAPPEIDSNKPGQQADRSEPPPNPPAQSEGAAPPKESVPGGVVGGVVGGIPSGVTAGATGAAPMMSGGNYLGRPPQPFSTEAYDLIKDNGWKLASQEPLSTFSADVDTAAYSNLRRFLNTGQRMPKDAVRIEEMINYFDYEYPDPSGPHPFSVTTEVGPCPWAPDHRLLMVGLQAKRLDTSQLPPRNLVFLVDVSGSMMPANKLPLVKAALSMLVGHLGERDRVAIVVYAGASGLVLPSTPASDRSRILAAISDLTPGGSTNGAAGIELAYQIARANFVNEGVNRVVLATDGDFNVGVTDRGSLLRLIEEKRKQGVALTVLGFGMGNLKDATLEQLADTGNGNYAYIDTLSEAQKVLVTEAGGTLVTVAKDVKLQLEFNPQRVTAFRLIGYENRVLAHQDFNNDAKDAGEIGVGHSVTALYELVPSGATLPDIPSIDPLKYQSVPQAPSPQPLASSEWLTVKLRYKQPGADVSVPFDVAVTPRDVKQASGDLRFAAAVAAFGMVLRESEYRGTASYPMAIELARTSRGADLHGHRAELINLIELAQSLGVSTTDQLR